MIFLGALAFNDYIDTEISQKMMVMKEGVYPEYALMAARKTWPYMYLLDDLILRHQQSGIGKYIELTTSMRTTDYKIQNNLRSQASNEDEVIPLKIAHIEGPLYLLGFGYMVALVAFILENCVYHYSQKYFVKVKD